MAAVPPPINLIGGFLEAIETNRNPAAPPPSPHAAPASGPIGLDHLIAKLHDAPDFALSTSEIARLLGGSLDRALEAIEKLQMLGVVAIDGHRVMLTSEGQTVRPPTG